MYCIVSTIAVHLKYRICLSVYLNVGNAITRLSTRLSVDQFGQNLGGRISSPPRHVRHDVVTMAPAVP